MGKRGMEMTTGGDVVSFLKAQHAQVTALFRAVRPAIDEERSSAFHALRRMLAVHETAEEEIVHPAARRSLENGEFIVAQRLFEERTAKEMLAELEELDLESDAFARAFDSLESAVLAHEAAEEATEFSQLADELDATRLERMQRAVAFAESVAPTRPQAAVESRAANLFVGPFASMVDRARDALQGAK
ncbi:MAG: hemerythrin domain-containing protein [Polyangiaceae bacterium]